jgi:pyruvate-ferredoxin/flavodoxin oxidoreductase
MVPQESQLAQQEVFDYCVANVSKKPGMMAETTVKGSQFNQPLLEFSGSCAGCAETSYARLITQLFGERMFISNATGCSSIWGGPAATSPYTRNRLSGKGPAWANSLFEDNAEHGFGMYLGQKTIRNELIETVKTLAAEEQIGDDFKAAAKAYLDTVDDGKANGAAAEALVAVAEKYAPAFTKCGDLIAKKQYLDKKSVWIFGGDGWAYDIGFGGLDHVLASGEDVNVMVFDTEVYSNTGGQASKASRLGQVAQFAAAGKSIAKKNLAEIAMSYGYVYVAQIAMGADQNQTLKAILEAESYPGPSLIIGYAPCEMHGIKGGMTNCQAEMKRAVACGYWNNFRFDPRKKSEGQNPFTLDSKAPTADYKEFLENETRYSRLERAFPERAVTLFEEAEDVAKDRYEYLTRLSNLYAPKED